MTIKPIINEALGTIKKRSGLPKPDAAKEILTEVATAIANVGMRCLTDNCSNKKKLPISPNYAGMVIRKASYHAFPDRITDLKLPGCKEDYLCEECANRYNVRCNVHGTIPDRFKTGVAPSCIKCVKESEALMKGELSSGFTSFIPLSKISFRDKIIKNKGYLCVYKNQTIYLHDKKKTIYWGDIKEVTPKIKERNKSIILELIIPSDDPHSCDIELNDTYRRCRGNWLDLWLKPISEKLRLTSTIQHVSIGDVKFDSFSRQSFDCITKINDDAICIFCDKEIHFLPSMNNPNMESLNNWSQNISDGSLTYILNCKVDGLPQNLIIEPYRINPCSIGQENLSILLPDTIKIENPTDLDISTKKYIKATKYPEREELDFLIEKKDNGIIGEDLQNGQKTSFTEGFNLEGRWLLTNESLKSYITFKLADSSSNILTNIRIPSALKNNQNIYSGILIDHGKKTVVKIDIYDDGFSYNGNHSVEFGQVKDIQIRKQNTTISEVIIEYNKKNEQLRLSAPVNMAQNLYKILEVNRAKATSTNIDLAALYRKYNLLKKQNLLVGIFTDILLLKRELDMDVSMSKLEKQLQTTSDEKFFKTKDLYHKTTKKLLILSHTLPKIRQSFHYLATFYPYHQLKNEMKLISEAFGPQIAKKIQSFERKHIVRASRGNVRNLQSNLQHIFSEIEKAIYPVNQIFARDEIKNTLKAKIKRNLPTAAQAALVGTAAVFGLAGGGFGVLAGMIGIRELGNILNSIQKDKQSAIQIKKAAEDVLSWWRVFMDTFPVTIFEIDDLLEDENNRCMIRDKHIFDKLSSSDRKHAQSKLKNALLKKIEEGTKNRFVQVVEGEGITFDSLAQKIQFEVENDLPKLPT